MPMCGTQADGHFRNGPQPLGVFCNARTFPSPYSRDCGVFNKSPEISKSGFLFGLVDGCDWVRFGHEDLDEAATPVGGLPRQGSHMDDVWAGGLRLVRCAV